MYDRNIVISPTNVHFKIVFNNGISKVYLLIISKIVSGKYFPIMVDTSFNPILYFMNVKILKKISMIARRKTNDEKRLKNMITTIINNIN